MDFLSSGTGLFMTDCLGTVINSRYLYFDKDTFPVLCDMVNDEDYLRFLSHKNKIPAFVMCENHSEAKDFVLVIPYKQGFQRGVILKCGDKGFTSLSDYYQHLCTYKDYLSSLSTLSFSPSSQKALSVVFGMKLSGIFHLLKLSSFDDVSDKGFPCPVVIFLDKVQALVQGMGKNNLIVSGSAIDNIYIDTIPRFLKIFLSCIALCFRKSTGDVNLLLSVHDDSLTFKIHTKSCGCDFDIFESNIVSALSMNGADFDITRQEDMYQLCIRHKCTRKTKTEVREIAYINARLDELFEKDALTNMFYCIAIK